jgi:DNA-binding NtrC family response regulator
LLARLPQEPPRPAVIVVTADGQVDTAVEAMRRGADDYLVKPFRLEELALRAERALARRRLAAENADLRRRIADAGPVGGLVGSAPALRAAVALLTQAAASDATVLITGESGTGKELAARLVHDRSPRAAGPFVVVNCAAIPDALLESELFGHARGAFTGADADRAGKFERAHGGTLYFDEIGELKLPLQAKLLRALQEHEIERVGGAGPRPVDVRIVAATNKDLKAETAAGRFREDLWYRLNVVTVAMPPLRDRREDLPALCAHFLRRYGRPDVSLSAEALDVLRGYRWPGNVRELAHVLERALVLLGAGTLVTPDLFPDDVRGGGARPVATLPPEGASLAAVERALLVQALERTGGNRTRAAKLLGLTRSALLSRMAKHGLR